MKVTSIYIEPFDKRLNTSTDQEFMLKYFTSLDNGVYSSLYKCDLPLLISLSFWIWLFNIVLEPVLPLLHVCPPLLVKFPVSLIIWLTHVGWNISHCYVPPPIYLSFWFAVSNSLQPRHQHSCSSCWQSITL